MLENNVAIVTGATRGIGKAIALRLAQSGADIVFTYLKSVPQAQELEEAIRKIGRKALALQMDVRDFDKAKELVEKAKESFGRLDILVNNAGITQDKALMMMTKNDWQDVLDTNLGGTFNVTRNAIVTFLKQKSGAIVNVTSVSGVAGLARQTNYSASKAGIIGFTKALAKEVAPYNIRVNAVAPGFIETDMVAGLKPEYKEAMLKHIPLGRFGNADEVSGVVEFLVSGQSQYITGQVIVIDGGMFMLR
jgi:3-oxoacyl-[acyl-carrier protein] reductase